MEVMRQAELMLETSSYLLNGYYRFSHFDTNKCRCLISASYGGRICFIFSAFQMKKLVKLAGLKLIGFLLMDSWFESVPTS